MGETDLRGCGRGAGSNVSFLLVVDGHAVGSGCPGTYSKGVGQKIFWQLVDKVRVVLVWADRR